MCIAMTNLFWLVISILAHQPLVMVLHVPRCFFALSCLFKMYMVWKPMSIFFNILGGNIRAQVSMSKLISYHYQYEIRNILQINIWAVFIVDWKSEPHNQYQKISELGYHNIKCLTNTIIGCTCAPAYMWFIPLLYVCILLYHTHADDINCILITK